MTHIWIDARAPYAGQKLYSITLVERLLRQLFELGIRQHVTVVLRPEMQLAPWMRTDFWPRYPIAFDTVQTEAPLLDLLRTPAVSSAPIILLEGDGIYDERILTTLLTSRTSTWIDNPHQSRAPLAVALQPHDRQHVESSAIDCPQVLRQGVCAGWLNRLSVDDMDAYIVDLRQHATPFLLRLEHPGQIRDIENALYDKTFKGVMDFIATYIYRIPVRGLVRLLAPSRITPNMVTAMSVLCSFAAIPLFAMGWLWTGFLAAYTFVICDSLDGKLARMTIRLSKLAGKIDHATSTPFECCYYLAWAWHFSGGNLTAWPAKAALFLFVCFCLDKITTGTFSRRFQRSLFDYAPWDARFHLVAGRRTINFSLMAIGCALQQPAPALTVTAIWMFITMSWHMSRFAWHARRGKHRTAGRLGKVSPCNP